MISPLPIAAPIPSAPHNLDDLVVALGGLHPVTADLVVRFATALASKLADSERKYGYSDDWRRRDWLPECRAQLAAHLIKGDPRDVAAYAAFLWDHQEPTHVPGEAPAQPVDFQSRVDAWLRACLGDAEASDRGERNVRFLEEALELVQACGGSALDAHRLVDYVFDRPIGAAAQEVGGVMLTLSALCTTHGIAMTDAGESELDRVWTMLDQIRRKHAGKPRSSADLPSA